MSKNRFYMATKDNKRLVTKKPAVDIRSFASITEAGGDNEQMCAIMYEDGKYGILYETGKTIEDVFDGTLENIMVSSNKYIFIEAADGRKYAWFKERTFIPITDAYASDYGVVLKDDDGYFFMDRTNVFESRFDNAFNINDRFVIVLKNEKFGIFDWVEFKMACECEYDDIFEEEDEDGNPVFRGIINGEEDDILV